MPLVLQGVPARRWQRVQWQCPAVMNAAESSNSTAPHAQDPRNEGMHPAPYPDSETHHMGRNDSCRAPLRPIP